MKRHDFIFSNTKLKTKTEKLQIQIEKFNEMSTATSLPDKIISTI